VSTPTTDPFDLARAVPMIVGYDLRWADEMTHYEVLEVESEFRTALVNPETGASSRTWTLGGKLDVLVRDVARNARIVIDHKTASEDVTPGSDYIKRLRLDGQISIYFDGGCSFGGPIDSFLYDVLKKPQQRPYKATPLDARKFTKDGRLYANQHEQDETPAEFQARIADAIAADPAAFYQRAEVVRLEAEMDEARLDVWQLGQALRESERLGRFPRNPDSCVRYGRTCEFFGVCTGEASIDDPSLFRRSDVVHAELQANALDRALLTSSRLKDARACQRLHRFKYLDGVRAASEAEALRFGSLIHLALEAWWRAPSARLEAALAAMYPQPTLSLAVASAQ
jgi:hypothetical protein